MLDKLVNIINFSLSGGNQMTIKDKTFGYSGAISYKNSFHFIKINSKLF